MLVNNNIICILTKEDDNGLYSGVEVMNDLDKLVDRCIELTSHGLLDISFWVTGENPAMLDSSDYEPFNQINYLIDNKNIRELKRVMSEFIYRVFNR